MGSQRVGHDWATELNWPPSRFISPCAWVGPQVWLGRPPSAICPLWVSPALGFSIHNLTLLGLAGLRQPLSLSWLFSCSVMSDSFCNPMDCSSPGSSVHGISQTRNLEWVVISFSRGSSWPRDQTASPFVGGFFTTEPPEKPHTYPLGKKSTKRL